MADLISFPELEKVLEDFARDFGEGYKEELLRNGRRASGKLVDTVTTEVETGIGFYSVSINFHDCFYWKYIENGTRPHWPPRDAILRWITVKPVIPRPDRYGRIPSPQSLAYLISRKIATVGTEGSQDLQKTKDALIPLYRQRIAEALGNDMANYFRRVTEF